MLNMYKANDKFKELEVMSEKAKEAEEHQFDHLPPWQREMAKRKWEQSKKPRNQSVSEEDRPTLRKKKVGADGTAGPKDRPVSVPAFSSTFSPSKAPPPPKAPKPTGGGASPAVPRKPSAGSSGGATKADSSGSGGSTSDNVSALVAAKLPDNFKSLPAWKQNMLLK